MKRNHLMASLALGLVAAAGVAQASNGWYIEPRVGGHCIEHGPNGFRLDWGTVLTWQPPERLSMLWQIGPQRVPEPNPASASTLEVNFVPKPSSKTLVQVEHRGFEKHGEAGEAYRDAMASKYGWQFVLARYAAAASR